MSLPCCRATKSGKYSVSFAQDLVTYFWTIRIRIKELPPKGEGHKELMAHEDEASLDPTSPMIGYTRLLHLRHSLNTS